ncbi:FecCD family ABC transporter permease [Methanocaldococcus indicus]|uniref:FecCD family ABC transporter permease n=1 Tax=Methanocaldococcus indicus TaxID=213231 RepID=UPI003C6D72C6
MRKLFLICFSFILTVFLGFICLCIGKYYIPINEIITLNLSKEIYKTIIFDIRLPRIIMAILVGAALAVSGATYQGVFRNPLVSPYILGVSSGAAFGAALSIIFPEFPLSLQLSAFVFGLLTVYLAYSLARVRGRVPLVTLLLAGVILGSFFSAMVAIFQYIATEAQLKAIVFWLMGGLYSASWDDVKTTGILIPIGIILLQIYSWKLNVLSLGDDEARALGINTERLKILLITLATFITSLAVSVTGIIGWVGLMMPHAARLIIGPDHRYLLPLSASFGAIFLLICDTIARTITTGEVPLGIVTSLLGAPYLIYLIRNKKNLFFGD